MKKALSLLLSVAMVLSLLTGITFTAGAQYVEFTAEFLTQPSGWNMINGLQSGQLMYSDNEKAQIIIDDEDVLGLENAIFIQTRNQDTIDYAGKYNSQTTQAKIKVNKSCDVYVFTTSLTGALKGLDYIYWLGSPDYGFDQMKNSDGTDFKLTFKNHQGKDKAYYVYKKTLNIPEGITSVIELGYVGQWMENNMYSAAIVESNDRDEATAKHNITLSTNSPNKWTINRNVKQHDPMHTDSLYKYDWYQSDSKPYWHGLDYYGLEGADAIMTANEDMNNSTCKSSNSSIDTWATMTIDNSAEIYVVSPDQTARTDTASRWMNWTVYNGFTEVRDEAGNHLCLSVKNETNSSTKGMYLYKRTVYVPEGETAKVNLGRIGAWVDPMYTVLVKWIENDNSEKIVSLTNNNNTNWRIIHNTSITADNKSRLYYGDISNKDSLHAVDYVTAVNGNLDFSDVSIIQPARDEYNASYQSGLPSYKTVETATVNHSCEVYILTRYDPHTDYLAWISHNGFKLQDGTVTTTYSAKNGFDFHVYKRTYNLLEGETANIPIGGTRYTWVNCTPVVIVKWIDNVSDKGPQVTFTVPETATREYYIYAPETFVDDRLCVGYGSKVLDYGNTGLEGLSVLKPFNTDMISSGYTTEDLSKMKVFDYYNITLDTTTELYVSTGNMPTDTHLEWLKGWELLADENGNPITYTTTNYNGSVVWENYVYKKLFVVPEGQTRTVSLRNAGAGLSAAGMYPVFFKFIEEEIKTNTVTITADENAKVFPYDLTIDVREGETALVNVGAKDGYFVKSVKVNGEEKYKNIWEDDFSFYTDAITEDATIEVVTEKIENLPLPSNLESLAKAFSAKGEEDVIANGKVYDLNVIAFGTALEKIGPHERGEFGMLVLMEKPDSINDLMVTNENVIKAPATGSNAKGQYGIRLYGETLTSGQKCYLRAYAYYGDTVVYGTNVIEAEF